MHAGPSFRKVLERKRRWIIESNPSLPAFAAILLAVAAGPLLVRAGTPAASGTLAKGDTRATPSVPTTGDLIVAADSTVTASLVAGPGYTLGAKSSAAVTVEDDDLPNILFRTINGPTPSAPGGIR